jgi:hypothetical protein
VSAYESPITLNLTEIIGEIQKLRLGLPDFQRSFVWDPAQVVELLSSVCQGFPIGAILRTRYMDDLGKVRQFSGAPEIPEETPATWVVLDGQQRLTSLYRALTGSGYHKFYLDLDKLRAGFSVDECLKWNSPKKSKEEYRSLLSPETQYESLTVPFSQFATFEDWDIAAREHLSLTGAVDARELMALDRFFRKVRAEVVESVLDYEVPVLTLSEGVSMNAICTIFETINRTGTKLGVFDLLTARFRVHQINLRDEWETAQEQVPLLRTYQIDPYYLLQGISAVVHENRAVKRSDVLELTAEDFRTHWEPMVKAFGWVLDVFRDNCGVAAPKWLPYSPMVIAPAATFVITGIERNPEAGDFRSIVERWFFASSLGTTYDQGANGRITHDVQELTSWYEASNIPEWIEKFLPDRDAIRDATSANSAIYRAIVCLYMTGGPMDFESGQAIDSTLLRLEEVHDHHVFPEKYLNPRNGEHEVGSLANSVLNRALLTGETNRIIGVNPPSKYLNVISKRLMEKHGGLGAARLDQRLESHMLPSVQSDPFVADDYHAFLDFRLQRVVDAIQSLVTGETVKVAANA